MLFSKSGVEPIVREAILNCADAISALVQKSSVDDPMPEEAAE
jgi:hypothetical protein